MLESKEKNVSMGESIEAEEEKNEDDDFCWIERIDGDIGGIIQGALYDLVKDDNVELDEDNFYIKKVGQHLEVGKVKKIELIY